MGKPGDLQRFMLGEVTRTQAETNSRLGEVTVEQALTISKLSSALEETRYQDTDD